MNILKRLWTKVTGSFAKGEGAKNLVEGDPILAEQFHPHRNRGLSAEDVTYEESSTTYWWQCTQHGDHTWESPLNVRIKSHGKCPFCEQEKYFANPNNAIDISASGVSQDEETPGSELANYVAKA